MSRYEILVSGVVQGIGYRSFAVQKANKLDIKGYVKNLADGKVMVLAMGEQKNLNAFIESLKIGPAFASVKKLDLRKLNSDIDYEDFHIEY